MILGVTYIFGNLRIFNDYKVAPLFGEDQKQLQ